MSQASPLSLSAAPLSASRREELAQLRQALAGRFPGAHPALVAQAAAPADGQEGGSGPPLPSAFSIPSPALTASLDLPKGVLTEAYGPLPAGALLLEAALRSAAEGQTMMALVDACSSFDPSLPASLLSRLLWVMAKDAPMAVKATDLLLRDGNLPLIVLDLQLAPQDELRRIPASTWYRYQRILEAGGSALLVLTPRPIIASAGVRLALSGAWSLGAMHQRREALFPQVERQQRQPQVFAPLRRSA